MPDINCWGGDIIPVDKDGYRPKSAILKCKCGKTGWHTKNIGYIGARTIYNFRCGGCEYMLQATSGASQECSCPGSDLSVDEELVAHVKSCEACRKYGL